MLLNGVTILLMRVTMVMIRVTMLMRVAMLLMRVTIVIGMTMVITPPIWVYFHLTEFSPPRLLAIWSETLFEPIWCHLSKYCAAIFQRDDVHHHKSVICVDVRSLVSFYSLKMCKTLGICVIYISNVLLVGVPWFYTCLLLHKITCVICCVVALD